MLGHPMSVTTAVLDMLRMGYQSAATFFLAEHFRELCSTVTMPLACRSSLWQGAEVTPDVHHTMALVDEIDDLIRTPNRF